MRAVPDQSHKDSSFAVTRALATMAEADAEEEETLVVVELPPEARLVASDELHFTGLGTSNPRLRLPSGEEYVGRYEESVGDLLVMKPGEDGAQLVGKSETRLIFRRADARAR